VGIKNPDGTYTDTSPFSFNGIDVENPVAIAREALDQNTTTRVQGGLDLKTVLVKGLTNTTVSRPTSIIYAATCIFQKYFHAWEII
jgi:hypothetical protein